MFKPRSVDLDEPHVQLVTVQSQFTHLSAPATADAGMWASGLVVDATNGIIVTAAHSVWGLEDAKRAGVQQDHVL